MAKLSLILPGIIILGGMFFFKDRLPVPADLLQQVEIPAYVVGFVLLVLGFLLGGGKSAAEKPYGERMEEAGFEPAPGPAGKRVPKGQPEEEPEEEESEEETEESEEMLMRARRKK